ncbi:MAG: ISKra4 family transposase [Terriglobales bacterium]
MQALATRSEDTFAPARHGLERMVGFLQSRESWTMKHSELERWIEKEGREVMRQLLQGHLDLRGPAEAEEEVRDAADGGAREVKRLHERSLATVFGPVTVERFGYRSEGQESLHPVDGELNLPVERYSLELRRRVAEQAAKSSFDETRKELEATTGASVAKRQVEELVARAGNAEDFDQFYATHPPAEGPSGTLQVITSDGKGVVMRREDLREATRKAAETSRHKLGKRLSRGEKRNRKRMATVAAVYTIAPFVRTPEQVAGAMAPVHAADRAQRPRPEHKRVWASLEKSPEQVLEDAFQEAERRDPERQKTWVAVVDGNKEQLGLLRTLARRHSVALSVVLDIIHVVEYLWKAAYTFHAEATPEAEQWVSERLLQVLKGRAGYVAGGIARSATRRRIPRRQRKAADDCVRYLLRHKAYLHYDKYLAAGFPIASGVIEGACRHLVRDRMDVTGARWSLKGAEAVLRLRALRSSGDFDQYWRFHEARELERNHLTHYAGGRLPRTRNAHLTLVR